MEVITTRFGVLNVSEEDRVLFEDGLPGLIGLNRYVVHRPEGFGPFAYLQSEDVPGLAMIVCSPRAIVGDFHCEIDRQVLADIDLTREEDVEVLVLVTNPTDPERMTANLVAPIVINRSNRLAMQVFLEDSQYSTGHKVVRHVPENNREPMPAVASQNAA